MPVEWPLTVPYPVPEKAEDKPAFPINSGGIIYQGLTVRTYLLGQVIAGLYANRGIIGPLHNVDGHTIAVINRTANEIVNDLIG